MKSSLRLISRVLVIALATTLVPVHVLAMEEVHQVRHDRILNAIKRNAYRYQNIDKEMLGLLNEYQTDEQIIAALMPMTQLPIIGSQLDVNKLEEKRALDDNALEGEINLLLQRIDGYLGGFLTGTMAKNFLKGYLRGGLNGSQPQPQLTQEQLQAAQAAQEQAQRRMQEAGAKVEEAMRAEERARKQEADLEAQIAAEERAIAQEQARLAAVEAERVRVAAVEGAQAVANRAQEALARANQQRVAFEEQERLYEERERAREAREREEARLQAEQEAAEQREAAEKEEARITAERDAESSKVQEEPVAQENLDSVENSVQQSEPEAQVRPALNNDFASSQRERYERAQAEAARLRQEQEASQSVHPVVVEPVIDEDSTEEESDNESDSGEVPVAQPVQQIPLEALFDGNNPAVQPALQPVVHEQVRTPREQNTDSPLASSSTKASEDRPINNDPVAQPGVQNPVSPATEDRPEVPPVVLVNNPVQAPDAAAEQAARARAARLAELRAQQAAAQAQRAAAHERAQQAQRAQQEAEQANQRAQAAAQPQPAAAAQGAPNAPAPAPAEGGLLGMLKGLWDTIKDKAQAHPKTAAAIGIAAALGLYKLISWFMNDDADDEDADADDAAPVDNRAPHQDPAQDPQDEQERPERPVNTTTTAPETQESRNLAAKRKRAQLRREFLKKRGRGCKSRCKRRCR